jgi:hypothetical protein
VRIPRDVGDVEHGAVRKPPEVIGLLKWPRKIATVGLDGFGIEIVVADEVNHPVFETVDGS